MIWFTNCFPYNYLIQSSESPCETGKASVIGPKLQVNKSDSVQDSKSIILCSTNSETDLH